MSFVSPLFLVFLPAVLILYFIVPQRFRWYVLLLSSYVFYWYVGGLFALAAITFTIVTVYASGIWAGILRRNKAKRALRRAPLAICLVLNFGLLAFFKFSAVITPAFGVLLIPGISFYTFQAAGYLIDVYTGKVQSEKNPLKAALFLSFFPQLIQGPISRHGEIASDLFAGHGWDWERSRSGIQRIIWGYFLKLVIANHAAPIVNAVLGDYLQYGGAIIILSILVYSIQIYADFAGGINIALGVAKMVGVNLPENFRQPFFASSLADYWRRWHITLGSWLRDYLFYPISVSAPMGKFGKFARKKLGKRVGKFLPSCIATFCVYLVVGVWHGSGMQLIAFGLLNGLFISVSLFAEPLYEKIRAKTRINGVKPGFGRVFSALRTLVLLVFLRYFVRSGSLREALSMLKQTLLHPRVRELWNGTLHNLKIDTTSCIVLAAAVIVMLARDFITERGKNCGELLNKARPVVQFVLLLAVLLAILIFGIYSGQALSANFIYAGY
jgi:D-alanyl-lipoteichoic acid acyltransferase DltB (MBOAT superfamily)